MVQEPIIENDKVAEQRIILTSTFRGLKRQTKESSAAKQLLVVLRQKPQPDQLNQPHPAAKPHGPRVEKVSFARAVKRPQDDSCQSV
jgi:hypothetical protein